MPAPSLALVLVVRELDESNAAYGAVQNFIDVYEEDVDRIAIIGPGRIDIDRDGVDPVPVRRPPSASRLGRIFSYLCYQYRLARTIWGERDRIDQIFFHIGGTILLLPMLVSKLAAVRSSVFILGSVERGYYLRHGHELFTRMIGQCIKISSYVTCTLATDVILLSKSMESTLTRHLYLTEKHVANFNYIDCTTFEKRTPIDDRPVDIVFVGRLEKVKGVDNIVQTIPALVNQFPRLQVTFVGDGDRRGDLERFVDRHGIRDNVTFTGWVSPEEVPSCLNDARLLLMPSVSEGVPKTLLEAMACGTIPVATSVGGIPDIVEEEVNGFVLSDAEPKTIEQTVVTVLERDDLEEISDNARDHVVEHHSYSRVRARYRAFLPEDSMSVSEGMNHE